MKLKITFLFIGLLSFAGFSQGLPPPCGLGYVLEACEGNNDGFAQFNLTNANNYLFCSTNESSFEPPKFYLSEFDAQTDTNPIPNFKNYTNITNPQTIYATAVYKSTGAVTILNPFDIEAKMLTYSVTRLEACDNDQDGLAEFDLTLGVLFCGANNPSDYSITYYISQEDANNRTNQLENPSSYTSATATIYIVIENINTGNFQHNSFDLIVSHISINSISNLLTCDDDSADGIGDFILAYKDDEITNGQTGMEVYYFEDPNFTIQIDKNTPYQNITNPQTIYVRVENELGCFDDSSFSVNVISAPSVTRPTPLEVCDDESQDGIEIFDLSSKDTEIIGGQTDVSISYYLIQADAEVKTNMLPTYFTNFVTPQTIYVRVENLLTGCSTITTLDLVVKDCSTLGVIEVNAFYDANSDTTFDTNEINFLNGTLTYEKNNDGIQHVLYSSTGIFNIISDDEANIYDISYSIHDEFKDCYSLTTYLYENISVTNGSRVNSNFPVTKIKECSDVAVYLTQTNPPRPGFDYRTNLVIRNLGIETVSSGSVEFIKDDLVTFESVNFLDSGNSITNTPTGFILNFNNLQPNSVEYVVVNMNVPVSVNLGDLLTSTAIYSIDDLDISNNTSTLIETVIGSYDPNDIAESHGPEIFYGDFTSNDYLFYTIRFQNVGTADAINISIDNTLDSKLDKSTIQMLSASHDYVFTRTDNQFNWKFDNIHLPSESMDEPNSHGFVYYKIKPTAGFQVGDVIPNTAEIYFDFNAAVVTNTFETEFVATLSNKTFDHANYIMFPNPTNDFVEIKFSKSTNNKIQLGVYDIQGKLILEDKRELQNNATKLDVSNLKSGMYFLKVNDGIGEMTQKLIIN